MPRGVPKVKRKRTTDSPQETQEPIITNPDEEFGAPLGSDDPIGIDDGNGRAPVLKMLLNPLFLMVILSMAGMYLIVSQFAVTDGRYVSDITRLEMDLVDDRTALETAEGALDGKITDLTSEQDSARARLNNLLDIALTDNDLSSYATKASLDQFVTSGNLDSYATKDSLDDYVSRDLLDIHKESNSDTIGSIEETLSGMSTRISEANSDRANRDGELAAEIAKTNFKTDILVGQVGDLQIEVGNNTGNNHLWYTLAGDNGEYVLDVGSSIGGIFMGRITLLYDPPVSLTGNITNYPEALVCFYDMLDEPERSYIPTTSWDGDEWTLVQVEVYTSAFILTAEEEVSFNIELDGLGSLPDHNAFIEVIEGAVPPEGGGGSI